MLQMSLTRVRAARRRAMAGAPLAWPNAALGARHDRELTPRLNMTTAKRSSPTYANANSV